MRKLLVLIFILSCLISPSNQPIAHACTGLGFGLDTQLANSTYVVVGYFVDVDDIHMNSIFRVESYLVGKPSAEYIAIRQAPQHAIRNYYEGYFSCAGYQDVSIGDRGILFLEKDAVGSYFTNLYSSYIFPSRTSHYEVSYINQLDKLITHEAASSEDILRIITKITQTQPSLPNFTMPKVLHSPLLIVTNQASAYLLPVSLEKPILLAKNVTDVETSGDFVVLFTSNGIKIFDLYLYGGQEFEASTLNAFFGKDAPDCDNVECFQITGNGMYFMIQNEGYVESCVQESMFCEDGTRFPGKDFQASPTGKHIAVWDELELKIYALDAEGGQPATYKFSSETHNPQLIWSPDGTHVAFTDSRGLWVWSGFAWENQPRLLVSAKDGLSFASQFSPAGRYLLISNGNEEYYLDLQSSWHLPLGIFAPDEQHIILEDEGKNYKVCNIATSHCKKIYIAPPIDFFWIDNEEFMGSECIPECGLFAGTVIPDGVWHSFYSEENESSAWSIASKVIYDTDGGNIGILNSPTEITILYGIPSIRTGSQSANYITLDLSTQLDGDIVDIRWLEGTLFYQQ
jgi:hypothetical protein